MDGFLGGCAVLRDARPLADGARAGERFGEPRAADVQRDRSERGAALGHKADDLGGGIIRSAQRRDAALRLGEGNRRQGDQWLALVRALVAGRELEPRPLPPPVPWIRYVDSASSGEAAP